jgi:signal transduction histidine kinase
MYGIYNSFNSVMGSRFLTWVVRAFLVLNIALGLVQADSYQDCAVYVVFSAMILCAVHLIQTLTVTGVQEAEDAIGRATTANAVLGFMAQSARHDINNKLTLLEGAMWFTLGEEAMGKVHSQIMAISGLLDGLDATKRSIVDVHALAKGAYRAHYQDSSPESVRLDSSRTHYEIHESFVKSVVVNLIENAVEAGKRKNLDPRVSVLVGDGYIEVEDHSGGFDVVGIREGKSAKARKGHGKFLAMLTDTTIPSLFGLSVEIAPTLDGTRFRVRFA